MHTFSRALVAVCAASVCISVSADEGVRADSHAPIGVMAEHVHRKGEWMLSYRFMSMDMDGNRQGGDRISPDSIAASEPNVFFGQPMQPPTLRVVPLDMRMKMHMFGAMYAPSDRLTLMAMANIVEKTMDHVTYQGGMGTAVLGGFRTKTSGPGDTSLLALVSLINNPDRRLHLIAGLSVPTGAIDETGTILTPMNMQPDVRLPYPMQLGSGSFDPIVGASFQSIHAAGSWGGQWRSTLRLADNDEDYQLGNEHRLTAWAAYLLRDDLSVSVRLEHLRRDNIDGADALIVAPVQTADPNRQKATRTDFGIGLNYALKGSLHGYRLAAEYLVPVQQNFNGPQLETDSQLVLGLQKSW